MGIPARIEFIDGLRGLAALAVVLTHYNTVSWSIFSYGNLGVPVFFVLSGFVVTMSVGNTHVDAAFLGRFALRRAIRLDPPYWATILAVVIVGYSLSDYVKFDGVTSPQILAHMFYLQDAMGFDPILPVFWTLCYEIQFYLAMVLLLWAAQAIGARPHFLLLLTLLLSLIDRGMDFSPAAFMGRFWSCFALGALVHLWNSSQLRQSYLVATLLLVFAYGMLMDDSYTVASTVAAAAIFLALRLDRPDFLDARGWQFMGRISYSLYLTHPLFGWLALRAAEQFVPSPVALVFGIAVGIASAWVFYVLIERPSIQLSHLVSTKGSTARQGTVPSH